jgi:PAS domain S-box-containing protein
MNDETASNGLADLNQLCRKEESLITDLWNDVLSLKEKRHALSMERDLLRTLIDNMPDFIYVKDTHHRFVLNNKAHLKLLVVTDAAEALGKTDFDFFPREDASRYFADEAIILNYGTPIVDREEKNIDKYGIEIWVSTTKVPVRDDDGKIVGIVGISRNITHRKQAEEERQRLEGELVQAQKLETLGQLASGIVHDFNNILSAINGYATLLKHELADNSPVLAKSAEKICKAGQSATSLTRKLLSFVKKEPARMEPIELHEIIEGVVGLLGSILGKEIVVTHDLRAPHDTVMGDKSQLENAILNIAVNARDAMPQGGVLTFRTQLMAVGPGEQRTPSANLPAGTYVVLSIVDTGTGMDEATKRRIFEPFFTTKEKGKGTGLGLPSVYMAVKKHGGAIEVESEPGRGTTFAMYLPAHGFCPKPPETKVLYVTPSRGLILVVDDEEIIRSVVTESLKDYGCDVSAFGDGETALEYYRDHQREIDAVIVDLEMPGINGYECIRGLRAMNPDVPIIVATGGGDDSIIVDDGIAGYLRKPFEESELVKLVSSVRKKK